MGCGKSTIGVRLAKHLNYQFLDVDREINSQTNRAIRKLCEESTNDEFCKIEEKVFFNIISKNDSKSVISIGGESLCI